MFNTSNRSFKYGDGLFETIKVEEGKLKHWNDHYDRLKLGMDTLKFDDGLFPKEKWEDHLMNVVNRNYYKYAKLRLTVYRDAPGLYTPMTNKIGFLIEGVRYSEADSKKQATIKNMGVYEAMQKPVDVTSNCKTTSALIYVMASLFKKEHNYDDALVLNTNGNVCESSNSNLFIVKNKVVFTPALSEGCVAGVMRLQVIKFCELKKIECNEVPLIVKDLETADELFLTNAIAGIQSVESFKGAPKDSEFSLQLQAHLS